MRKADRKCRKKAQFHAVERKLHGLLQSAGDLQRKQEAVRLRVAVEGQI